MVSLPLDKDSLAHSDVQSTIRQLLKTVKQYVRDSEVDQVEQAIVLAQKATAHINSHDELSLHTLRQLSPLEHAVGVASILAQMHIDAVGVSAVVVFEAI